MKRIIIVCEGPTEVEFCKDVLFPFFIDKNIIIQTPKIKRSGGGIVPWTILKREIETHLRHDKSALVTSLLDYYGIRDYHELPQWDASKNIKDKSKRMDMLETAMQGDIAEDIRSRYLPYLQLHEFEGLLFNNVKVFTENIPDSDLLDKAELKRIIEEFPNPELINDSLYTAPSKRLLRLIRGYNKIVYGAILAQEIGLTRIRKKCPRFDAWVDRLLLHK